jgi:uncharacterized protein YidB (DUF937 family)
MGGLIETLRRHGLARQVDSWVGPGPNLPVSPAELARLLDPEEVDTLARQAGADRQALLREVSTLLPAFIDRLTPQGRVPQRAEEVGGAGLGALLDGLMGTQRRGPEGPI